MKLYIPDDLVTFNDNPETTFQDIKNLCLELDI